MSGLSGVITWHKAPHYFRQFWHLGIYPFTDNAECLEQISASAIFSRKSLAVWADPAKSMQRMYLLSPVTVNSAETH